jgi:hypothetical protein
MGHLFLLILALLLASTRAAFHADAAAFAEVPLPLRVTHVQCLAVSLQLLAMLLVSDLVSC